MVALAWAIFRLKMGGAWKEQQRIDKNFTDDRRRAAQQAGKRSSLR
jgi:hypothetical protein